MKTTKPCRDCGAAKDIDEFYRQAERVDGHRSDCKACHKARNKVNRLKNLKAWRQGIKNTRHADPRKSRARQAVYHELKSGRIERPNKCGTCGKKCKPQAHHADYNKKLDIDWLCTVAMVNGIKITWQSNFP